MKPTTQVRVDKFESMGSHCRIVGRKNHIINTEQYIKRSYVIRAMVRAEVESGFTFADDANYWRPFGERMGHVPLEFDPDGVVRPVQFTFEQYPINRSIEKLLFRPLTSANSIDCRPADQLSLLPYLCEDTGTLNMQVDPKKTETVLGFDTYRGAPQDAFVADGFPYRYYPDEGGVFFVTFTTADGDAGPETILQRILPQEHTLQGYSFAQSVTRTTRFVSTANGADPEDGLEGISFTDALEEHPDEDDDGITYSQREFSLDFATFEFCINSSIFGYGAGERSYQFRIPDQVSFRFDDGGFGTTEGVENDYFHQIVLWHAPVGEIVDGVFVPDEVQPYTAELTYGPAGDINDNGGVGGNMVETIILHLPRRRFSRGHPSQQRLCPILKNAFTGYNAPVAEQIEQSLENQLKWITWFLRDVFVQQQAQRVYGLGIKKYGTLIPHFQLNGNVREMLGYRVAGEFATKLTSIANDGAILATVPYIINVTFPGQIVKSADTINDAGMGFYENDGFGGFDLLQYEDDNREVYIKFTKAAIYLQGGLVYLNQSPKYIRLQGDDIFHSEAKETEVDQYNFVNGTNIVYEATVRDPRVFGQQNHFNANPLPMTAGIFAEERLSDLQLDTCILHSIADTYWNHTIIAGGLYPAVGQDPLYDDILRSQTGTVRLHQLIPSTAFEPATFPIVRSSFKVELEEPLLGFAGMTPFRPSSILPSLEYLPPFIQDYNLTLFQRTNQKMINKWVQGTYEGGSLFLLSEPVGNYEITVRSQNNFDQKDKSLQKADVAYPFFERFVADGASIKCITAYGLPDFVFIRLEREYTNRYIHVEFEPVITTLKMKIYNQDVKTVSSYDANQIYHLTRRNSNYRTNTVKNAKLYGAVLLSRNDLGNFSTWDAKERIDNFEVDFTAQYLPHHPSHTLNTFIRDEILNTPIKIKVLFAYKNHSFSGTYNNCRFWQI